MSSVFAWLARHGSLARRALAAEAAARPLRVYGSRLAAILDPAADVAGDSEPVIFRQLVRSWHDRDAADQLTEAIHQRDLERAARPPVIEVTVTTPAGGIPRADLARLVQAKVAQAASASALAQGGPQVLPVIRAGNDTQVIEVRAP